MIQSKETTLNLPHEIGSQMIADMCGPFTIELREPEARLNLRIAPVNREQASKIFGLDIPAKIQGLKQEGSRAALCLGPDEWLLFASENEKDELIADFEAFYASCPHSLTDISDRQVKISLKGKQASELLSIGCPRNLDQLPSGAGTRTLFDSVEVTLLRHGPDHFEMEVWRSFLPHIWALLHIGNQELAVMPN
jgi:sarcosine oxidase subunit gamma